MPAQFSRGGGRQYLNSKGGDHVLQLITKKRHFFTLHCYNIYIVNTLCYKDATLCKKFLILRSSSFEKITKLSCVGIFQQCNPHWTRYTYSGCVIQTYIWRRGGGGERGAKITFSKSQNKFPISNRFYHFCAITMFATFFFPFSMIPFFPHVENWKYIRVCF